MNIARFRGGMPLTLALALTLFVGALASCSKAPGPEAPAAPAVSTAPENGERRFDVRGIVRGIDAESLSVTVEHEDIPGLMPSMTMPFDVKEARELRGIAVDQAIAFQFVVGDTDSWITGLRVISRKEVSLPEDKPPTAASRLPRLKEGDRIPEFSLIDQAGHPLTREMLAGKRTLLTFIFTRCPIPNFCPLMSQNFFELQKKIAADPALARQTRLLSISFDPLDTPETLTRYAKGLSADPALWLHAGGSQEETDKLTHAFSVYVQQEGGFYSHGLCTALILPDGTIAKIWRGNAWSVDEVWQALQNTEASEATGTASGAKK